MMDHRETAADGVYRMILYILLCFASVPVFIFGGAARKVAGINYDNPITESCHVKFFMTPYTRYMTHYTKKWDEPKYFVM